MIAQPIRKISFILSMVTYGSSLYALPFEVVDVPGSPTPAVLIKNMTSIERSGNYFLNKTPGGIGIAVLPGSCVNSLSETFTLSPKGQDGDSCLLNLAMSGQYTNNPPLLVCARGGKTCAGVKAP